MNIHIGGGLIKSNEQYDLYDNTELKTLTISKTILHPLKSTNGHKHEGIEEVYFILSGYGEIQIDGELTSLQPGQTIYIQDGQFHRVHNRSEHLDLIFVSVFNKYER